MKSLCTTGLILLGTFVAGAAGAQAQAYHPAPGPWPGTAPPGVQPVSYYTDPLGGNATSTITERTEYPSPQYQSEFDAALHSPCCDECDMGCDACGSKWWAIAAGLVMTRNRAPATWLTNTVDDFYNFQMNSQHARAGWTGGGQVTLGFAWCGCGGPAVALTYWGLAPMNGSYSVSDTTGNPATALDSTIDFSGVTVNGQPGSVYFNESQEQALWRQDTVNNFEINFQSSSYGMGNFQIVGLVGFRYFGFDEDLTYGAASFGNSFTSNGGADAAYLDINSKNKLYGGQIGAVINSCLTHHVTAFAVPKVGIYGNQMNVLYQIYSGATPGTPAAGYIAQKDDAAILSELDLGLAWAFSDNWLLTCGYRVVAVSNLALSDNQYSGYGGVEQNGDLILHGGFVGLGWLF